MDGIPVVVVIAVQTSAARSTSSAVAVAGSTRPSQGTAVYAASVATRSTVVASVASVAPSASPVASQRTTSSLETEIPITSSARSSSSPPPPSTTTTTSHVEAADGAESRVTASSSSSLLLASPVSSSAPAASSSSSSSQSTFSVAHIAAIAAIAAAVLIVTGVTICCVRRRRTRRRRPSIDLAEPPGRAELTRSEAESVLIPPHASHAGDRPLPPFLRRPDGEGGHTGLGGGRGRRDAASRASAWTDDTEFDMYAVDGSSVARSARTLSTVSRPNSEYDIEGDAGTWNGHGGAGGGAGTYMSGGAAGYAGYASTASTPTGTWVGLPSSAASTWTAAGSSARAPPAAWQPRVYAGARPPLVVDTKLPSGAAPAPGYPYATAPSPYYPASASSSTPSISNPLVRAPSAAQSLARAPSGRAPPPTLARGPSVSHAHGYGAAGYAAELQRGPSTRSHDSDHSVYRANPRFPAQAAGERLPMYAGAPGPAAQAENPFAESELAYTSAPVRAAAPALRRGPTIIRHADAGRVLESPVEDAVDDEVHLPPAYGDLYGLDGAPRR